GTANFTIQVRDNSSQIVSRGFSLKVNPPVLIISTTSPLPDATVGASYSQTLTATGGVTPYTWSVTTGSLPAGLTLSTAGIISGAPTISGTANFTIQVTDNSSQVMSRAFSLKVNPPPLVIITASPLPDATAGVSYSQTVTVSGGVAPYSWSIPTGSLPTGLTL